MEAGNGVALVKGVTDLRATDRVTRMDPSGVWGRHLKGRIEGRFEGGFCRGEEGPLTMAETDISYGECIER